MVRKKVKCRPKKNTPCSPRIPHFNRERQCRKEAQRHKYEKIAGKAETRQGRHGKKSIGPNPSTATPTDQNSQQELEHHELILQEKRAERKEKHRMENVRPLPHRQHRLTRVGAQKLKEIYTTRVPEPRIRTRTNNVQKTTAFRPTLTTDLPHPPRMAAQSPGHETPIRQKVAGYRKIFQENDGKM